MFSGNLGMAFFMFRVAELILRRSWTMRNCVFFVPFICARYVDAFVRSLRPSYLGTKRRFETVFGVWHS